MTELKPGLYWIREADKGYWFGILVIGNRNWSIRSAVHFEEIAHGTVIPNWFPFVVGPRIEPPEVEG